MERILAQADAALYRAKTEGRNRIAVLDLLPTA
jgi:PleD family two-component response regulator